MTRFDRVKPLFEGDFERLQNSKVIILGVGGVGGYCLDALWRSGVTCITIVDFDEFDITNQNRQIGSENIGQSKVETLVRMYSGIEGIDIKITPAWVEEFDFSEFDLVIDAIDDMPAKVAVALKCYEKLISSMGSAKKLDPTKIQVTNIWKTYNDGLAKKFRTELKKARFSKKFDVVFSDEEATCKEMGSFVGVTGSFGFVLASLAIKKLRVKST